MILISVMCTPIWTLSNTRGLETGYKYKYSLVQKWPCVKWVYQLGSQISSNHNIFSIISESCIVFYILYIVKHPQSYFSQPGDPRPIKDCGNWRTFDDRSHWQGSRRWIHVRIIAIKKHNHHDVELYHPPPHNHSVPPPPPSDVVLKRGTSPLTKPTGSQDNVFSPQSLSGSRRRFLPSVDLMIKINVFTIVPS